MADDPFTEKITRLNADREVVVRDLLSEVRAADGRMDQLRGQMTLASQWRQQRLAQLRQFMPVAEIAEALDVSRQAVYAAAQDPLANDRAVHPFWQLNVDPGQVPERETVQEVVERLAVDARQAANIAEGRTPSAINEVGYKILSEDLSAAILIIGSVGRRRRRRRFDWQRAPKLTRAHEEE